jgi:hypothetical protein
MLTNTASSVFLCFLFFMFFPFMALPAEHGAVI